MIAAWMLVSVVLGTVIALGALALDGAARAAHRTVRWVWAGAICAVVLLTMLLPLRRASDAATFRVSAIAPMTTGSTQPVASTPLALRVLGSVRSVLDVPFARLARTVVRAVSPAADRWLLVGWVACSLALLVLGAYVLRRLLDARRSWPIESLHGVRVHVAPSAGPAVLGFVRGAIVVPCWLAECPAEVQQVVLAHEREHLRARDPLLLTLGAVAVILLPWNPAVWWMLARLRLAVELDCDRRVLDAGVRARDYGTLLIDLAGRTAGIPLGAPLVGLTTLAERTTHLERRIVAMSAPRPRHTALRIATGSFVALAAILAACEAKMPTSVDVDNMNAASAERAATVAGLLSANDSQRTYYIDGHPATAAEARAVPADRIASITVLHDTTDHSKGTVRLMTRDAIGASRVRAPADTNHVTIQFARKLPAGAVPRPGVLPDTVIEFGVQVHPYIVPALTRNPKGKAAFTAKATFNGRVAHDSLRFAGVTLIDGQRVDNSAMARLDRAEIQSVEVIKGPRAVELYPNDPAAAQGVIRITTKHGTH